MPDRADMVTANRLVANRKRRSFFAILRGVRRTQWNL